MKILTTAGFSVLLLRKKLLPAQWASLLFLAIGVGVVQIQSGGGNAGNSLVDLSSMDAMKGFLAVTAACFTSGLAGVYFEMVLKNSQADLWVRNVQLSLFSLIPALTAVIFSPDMNTAFMTSGWFSAMFRNFGGWAWATVSVQVLGGLVTAMVIKYSDNILKGFATSLSIVISFLASVALFDFQITFTFLLGSVIVLSATWLYNQPPKRLGMPGGKDVGALARNLMGNEKWRGNMGPRSPAAKHVEGELGVLLSSGSRTSSVISLSLSATPTSPPVLPHKSDSW